VPEEALDWMRAASYDMESASDFLKVERWLYVLFTCQQAVEKLLKALVVAKSGQLAPRTHDLLRLAECCDISHSLTESHARLLQRLTAVYTDGRYRVTDFDAWNNETTARRYYSETKEVFCWLSSQMPS
jgi:HEPN domain-containing protein